MEFLAGTGQILAVEEIGKALFMNYVSRVWLWTRHKGP